MSFRLVPESVTLNDLERRNGPYLITDAFHDTDGLMVESSIWDVWSPSQNQSRTDSDTWAAVRWWLCHMAQSHTLEHIQKLMDSFANAAKRFGLTISLKKTKIMLQACAGSSPSKPNIFINGTPLNVVDKFCYHGNVLSQNAEINDDITRGRRIGAASAAFGKLESRLWKERGVPCTPEQWAQTSQSTKL